MAVKGPVIVAPILLIFAAVVTYSFVMLKQDKGREHNFQEQIREFKKKKPLEEMRNLILEKKGKREKVTLEELKKYCGEFEYYYFPEAAPDMRKILVCSKYESLCKFKNMDGSFREGITSIGFAVMRGDYKIKMMPISKVKEVLPLLPLTTGKGHEVDPAVLSRKEPAFLIRQKKVNTK